MISPLLTLLASGTTLAPPTEAPDWIDFYADMRMRAESTMDQSNGEDRHRGRMRFRAGAKFQISDELKSEVRLSTFSGDPRNPHWDFGGSSADHGGGTTLSGADVQLDRLNLVWTPSDSLTFVAGKMGAPLAGNPVFAEWIWDGDLQPTGLAGIWSMGGDMDFDVRLGHFIVDEVNVVGGSTTDPAITVLQANLGDSTDSFDWDINTTLWNWNGEGVSEYSVWDTVLAAKVDDLTCSFEFFQNLDDDTGEDTGMALGLKYGAGGKQGQSQVFGSFFDFDGNANVWGVAQDDVPLGVDPVDGLTGFVAGWKYWWTDTVTFKVWALTGDDETDDPMRLRFDIDVKLKH